MVVVILDFQYFLQMVSYEQSSAEQMMVIERLQDRLRKLEHENETLCKGFFNTYQIDSLLPFMPLLLLDVLFLKTF